MKRIFSAIVSFIIITSSFMVGMKTANGVQLNVCNFIIDKCFYGDSTIISKAKNGDYAGSASQHEFYVRDVLDRLLNSGETKIYVSHKPTDGGSIKGLNLDSSLLGGFPRSLWVTYNDNNGIEQNTEISEGQYIEFITCQSQTHGPEAFELKSPSNGASGLSRNSINLQWNSSAYANQYFVYVKDNANNVEYNWVDAGNNLSKTISVSKDNTLYYWKVKAKNTQNNQERESNSTWSFTTQRNASDCGTPTPIEPTGDWGYNTNPTFKWGTAAFASKYKIHLQEYGSFFLKEEETTNTEHSFGTLSPGNYYWYVESLCSIDNQWKRSNTVKFDIYSDKVPILLVHGWQCLPKNENTVYDPRDIFKIFINDYMSINSITENFEIQNIQVNGRIYGKDESWFIFKQYNQPIYISNYNEFDPYNPNKGNPTKYSIFLYANRLKFEIEKILAYEHVKKINIIAHSMGGLIARTYLEYEDFGYNKLFSSTLPPVDKLIMLGTPNHGALNRNLWDMALYLTNNLVGDYYDNTNSLNLKQMPPTVIASILEPLKKVANYDSSLQMIPGSSFLNVLNYQIDADGINYSGTNVDQINNSVNYYTISGFYPNDDNVFRLVSSKFDLDSFINEALLRYVERLVLSLKSHDDFNDGFIHSSSVTLAGAKNFYIGWTSHSNLPTNTPAIKLVNDIINNKQLMSRDSKDYWGTGVIPLPSDFYYFLTKIASPVELFISDSFGNKTGIVNKGIVEDIPESFYSMLDEEIAILAKGTFSLNILGLESGSYGLFSSVKTELNNFNLINQSVLLINSGAIEIFTPNWEEIESGGTPQLKIIRDMDGNGVFDPEITSPYAPTNLSLSYGFNYPADQFNLINLHWIPSIQGTYPITGYNIYRKEIFTNTPDLSDLYGMTLIGTTNTNTTSFTDPNCEPTKIYQYYVEAKDSMGNVSPPSESKFIEMKILPPLSAAKLQYPANGSIDVIFKPNLLVSWLPVDNATHYHVQIIRDDTNEIVFDNKTNLVSGTFLVIPESVLKMLKTYRWTVKAMNTAGVAPISETWYFTLEGPDSKRFPLLLVHGQQSFGLKGRNVEFDPKDFLKSLASSMVGVNKDHILEYTKIPISANINDSSEEWYIWKVTIKGGTFRQEVYISNYTRTDPDLKRYPFPDESIFTYAKRLKAEVDAIRNKQNAYVLQVDIVAHGMGGLVSRTYIESNDFIGLEKAFPDADPTLFDHDEDYPQPVRNLVLINTPNHGFSPSIIQKADYSIQNIKEMVIGSNFLNVLNYGLNDTLNHDSLFDLTRLEVQYHIVGSIFYNKKMRDEIGSTNRDRYTNLWIIANNTELNLYDNYSRYAHPDSLNQFDEISDGLLHYDSSQLYPLRSSNVGNYPFAWSSYNGILLDQSAHFLIQNLIYNRNLDIEDFIGLKGYWTNGENEYKYLLKSDMQQEPFVAKTHFISNQSYFSDTFEPNLSILFFNLQNLGYSGQNEAGFIFEKNESCYFSLLDQQIIAFMPGDYGLNVYGSNHGHYSLTSILCTNLVSKQFLYDELKPISNFSKDEYRLNWEGIRDQDINHNGMATVISTSNFSISSDYFCFTPSDPKNLIAALDFDQILITWEPSKKGTYAIERYEIYRKTIKTNSQKKPDFSNFTDLKLIYTHIDLSQPFEFLDTKVYKGETYQYFVIAVDILQHKSPTSNLSFAGPVLPKQKPVFDSFSIEPNKMVFTAKEEVLLKINVINSGNGDSNKTKLIIDLPDEIIFMSSDKYAGKQMHDGSVEFDLGKIRRRSSTTFQVNLYIYVNVLYEKTIPIKALLDSSDTDDVTRTINLLVKPKNTSGSNGSPIYVELLNCKHDQETGKPYIDGDTALSIKVVLSNFALPYEIKIQWGDGDVFNRKKSSELEFQLDHKYNAKGLMHVTITVIDSSGKSKSAEFSIEIK